SIIADSEGENAPLNLDNFQKRQTTTQRANANAAVDARIPETFHWLIVPTQLKADGAVEWQSARLQGQDQLAVRASKKLKSDGQLAAQFASTLLRQELDKIPLWQGTHVSLKQLIEYFAQYLYLQRLAGPDVLISAAKDGVALTSWSTDTFAYAEGWDEAKQRYVGLQSARILPLTRDSSGLLVKPEVASQQFAAEATPPPASGAGATTTTTAGTSPGVAPNGGNSS